MNAQAYISLLCGVAVFLMGNIVYSRNRKKQLNVIFLYLCTSVAYWGFAEFNYLQANSIHTAKLWLRLTVLDTFTLPLALHFIIVFVEKTHVLKKKSTYLALYGIPIIFMLLDLPTGLITGHIIPASTRQGWRFRNSYNLAHYLFIFWCLILCALIIGLCIQYYVATKEHKKKYRIIYVVTGFIVSVIVSYNSEILLPNIADVYLPSLSMASYAFACALIGFSMWRHKLFTLTPHTAAENIIDTMSDALLLIGIDKKINLVNRSALILLEYEERDIVGKDIEIVFDKRLNEKDSSFNMGTGFRGLIKTVIKGDTETCFVTSTGKSIPVSLSGSLIHDPENDLLGIVCIARDISERKKNALELKKAKDELEDRVKERTSQLSYTNKKLIREIIERKEAEKMLAEEKERLATTLRSIGDCVITTDTSGIVMLVNSAAQEFTGWPQEKAVGKPLQDILTIIKADSKKRQVLPLENIHKTEQDVFDEGHILFKARNGQEKFIEMNTTPIRNNNGEITGTVLVFRDITEKEKFEKEIFRIKKLESIGSLVGRLAHDFNNKLTGIITNLFIAKTHTDTHSEIYKLITEAEKAAFKASNLSKQLLTFSEESNTIKEMVSMKEIIEESIGFFLSGSNVDYRLELPDNLPLVMADKGQIDHLLHSIISNADDAMPEGGTITITGEKVEIDKKSPFPIKPGLYVKVSIKDEGAGIPQKYLEQIFDPYFSTKERGTGLGLASAYAIIKKHNGHIDVLSEMGNGTTISLFLPEYLEIKNEPDSKKNGPKKSVKNKKILLMDDEEIIRVSAQKLLVRMGYEVELCSNGDEMLTLYKKFYLKNDQFDVVIMDLTIPGGMGGKAAMKKLLEIDPNAKGILLSGYSNDEVMENFKEYGFSGVVAKPYLIEELKKTLLSVINENVSA